MGQFIWLRGMAALDAQAAAIGITFNTHCGPCQASNVVGVRWKNRVYFCPHITPYGNERKREIIAAEQLRLIAEASKSLQFGGSTAVGSIGQ